MNEYVKQLSDEVGNSTTYNKWKEIARIPGVFTTYVLFNNGICFRSCQMTANYNNFGGERAINGSWIEYETPRYLDVISIIFKTMRDEFINEYGQQAASHTNAMTGI